MKSVTQSLIRILFSSILVLFSLYHAEAGPLRRPLSFQHVTPKDGLSSEMVYAIAVQGEEVWFGTEGGGATLYDRSKKIYKAYTTKGEPVDKGDDGKSINWKNLLPYNHVSVIVPDVDRIWFGTYFYGFGGGGILLRSSEKPTVETFQYQRWTCQEGRLHGCGWRAGLGWI